MRIKYLYGTAFVALYALIVTVAFASSKDVESIHNTFVGKLHASNSQDAMCKIMESFYHPDNIRLSAANEHYNYVVDQISNVSGNYTKAVKNSKYRELDDIKKFRIFCSNHNSKLFSREGVKNFVKANRLVPQDGDLSTLEGTLDHRGNIKLFYLWKKSGNDWYFYYASTSKKPFPKIDNTAKQNIINVVSAHYRIDYTFDRCLGFSNQVFNSDHLDLLLHQVFGPDLKKFLVTSKKEIDAARKLEKQKVDQAAKLPNSCGTEKARDQVVIALLNAIGRNIRTVSMFAIRN